jgi:iron complex outermembrane receptor protein
MGDVMGLGKFGLHCCASIVLVSAAAPVLAQDQEERTYDLPAQDLKFALRTVARSAGFQLIADSSALRGKQAKSLKGVYTVEEAISALLEGSELIGEVRNRTVFVRGRGETPRYEVASAAGDDAITVTGSRINAPLASPLVTISRESMRDAGQNDLGEAVRALTQSHSGGQNPGIGIGSFAAGTSNFNSVSTLNLRGLGSDATLTLLNGHRLSFSGVHQAIDISAIPIDAVDRIEVLTDGASAIYGSDAVGGVANVILKTDYDGVYASGRIGGSTDGGNFEQQYSAVAGKSVGWGGFVATYDFTKNTPILAGERGYASRLFRDSSLFPSRTSHSASLSGHVEIAPVLTLAVDGLYNHRSHRSTAPNSTTASYRSNGSDNRAWTTSWALAPSLKFSGFKDWSIVGDIAAGASRAHYSTIVASGGSLNYDTHGCYCSTLFSAELSANGNLFPLGGGMARLALGGGYRRNALDYTRKRTYFRPLPATEENFSDAQESLYGFVEASLPLVGDATSLPFLRRLTLTGAVRYEDYRGMGGTATPKLGIIVHPSPDLEVKASWGRSFKAPTLYQQHLLQQIYLFDVTGYGTGYLSSSTILYRAGGNPDLAPERATNWTATLIAQPRALRGLKVEISAFHIRYSQRVLEPIGSASGILDSPDFRQLLTFNPTSAQIASAIAQAPLGLSNFASGAFDPAKVVAIVDNRFVNVAVQTIKGVDMAIQQGWPLSSGSDLQISAAASYLESRQQLVAGQPAIERAGIIFNPPHWRLRGSLSWRTERLTFSAFANHIGTVWDNRSATGSRIAGQTPIDVTLRYRPELSASSLKGLELTLSARNLFDDEPSLFATQSAYFTPYDSTNYSPLGRVLTIQVSKRW